MNLPAAAVEEAVKAEAPGWDDDEAWTARFRAFSGQRSDWAPRYFFWRDLIIRVAKRLGVISIRSSEVKNVWFSRGGLTPLCLNHVLVEMHKEGHVFFRRDLPNPMHGQIYRMVFNIGKLMMPSKSSSLEQEKDECLVLKELLQDKSSDVIKILAESHWTSSCVVTMQKFKSIFGGSDEALIILSYLVQCGKAHYLSIVKGGESIEGIKVSLISSTVPPLSNIDSEILHLIWTVEKMQKQLDVIDQQWEQSRKSALTAFKSGNKSSAARHIRCTKLLASSRERYASLLERVEDVVGIIHQSETTKTVSEAMQTGAQTIKSRQVNIDQVNLYLEELEEITASQKQVDDSLGSLESADVDHECEEEFLKLELELLGDKTHLPVEKNITPIGDSTPDNEALIEDSTSSLADTFNLLHLTPA